ncbi:hypothetical protein BD779DRAFT_1012377 [Infundibulicybe gibba]|nr:hypothetical protein BD779DRAFT_1012377 [Infundibulicybe gibba]
MKMAPSESGDPLGVKSLAFDLAAIHLDAWLICLRNHDVVGWKALRGRRNVHVLVRGGALEPEPANAGILKDASPSSTSTPFAPRMSKLIAAGSVRYAPTPGGPSLAIPLVSRSNLPPPPHTHTIPSLIYFITAATRHFPTFIHPRRRHHNYPQTQLVSPLPPSPEYPLCRWDRDD